MQTERKYRNNCTLPRKYEDRKTTYRINKKPVGKLKKKAMIKAAICGLTAMNGNSTICFFRMKL